MTTSSCLVTRAGHDERQFAGDGLGDVATERIDVLRRLTRDEHDRDIGPRLRAISPPGLMVCDGAHGCPCTTSPRAVLGRGGRGPATLRPPPPREHGALPGCRATRRRVLRRHERAGRAPAGIRARGVRRLSRVRPTGSGLRTGQVRGVPRTKHLAPFSCRRRGFCPSCGVRRMVETAAHLVDHVLPRIPLRQWGVTFPWPLRLVNARATRLADQGSGDGNEGVVQRAHPKSGFAPWRRCPERDSHLHSARRLSPQSQCPLPYPRARWRLHLRALTKPQFHRVPPPSPAELRHLLDILIVRIIRARGPRCPLRSPNTPISTKELNSPLDQLKSPPQCDIESRWGRRPGAKTMTLRTPDVMADDAAPSKPFTAA